jgi:fructose-bisphosphate aldolase, class I
MNAQEHTDTARTLVAGDQGLSAMDEGNPTCNKRFAGLGIPRTEEARRAYRELIVTTPGLGGLSIVMGNAGAQVQRCTRPLTG